MKGVLVVVDRSTCMDPYDRLARQWSNQFNELGDEIADHFQLRVELPRRGIGPGGQEIPLGRLELDQGIAEFANDTARKRRIHGGEGSTSGVAA